MIEGLPEAASRMVERFVDAAKSALGPDLVAVVLFGSAAEGRLRSTSDINAIVVLRTLDPAKLAGLREAASTAFTAVHLVPMVILESEIPEAARTFADKFADILRRRRVVFGTDPFATLSVPREAEIARLHQVLLNLVLRLREQWLVRGVHEEQLALVIADAAGPLRSAAAALLELEGTRPSSPKAALETVATAEGATFREALESISVARQTRRLEPGAADGLLLMLVDLADRLRKRARNLR